MTRWKIILEYDGTNFCGWQKQDCAIPSVQSVLEKALLDFCQQTIGVTAAGRTDAGVHAHGQVVHFDLEYGEREINGAILSKALNALVRPHAVSVLSADIVADDFNARFMARNKLYHYRIINRHAPLAIDQNFAWHIRQPLNLDAMRIAAKSLLGTHDFTSFRSSVCQAKSPIRTLDRLDISQTGTEVLIAAEARSFLHHQVRNMAGTLVEIGLEKRSAHDIPTMLAACDRASAGVTAPPHALSLMRVDY